MRKRKNKHMEDSSSANGDNQRGILGLYLKEVDETNLLTPNEEIALAKRIAKGDEGARDLMIRANLRLVVSIAGDYVDYGLPILDLINEGNMGLMVAVDRYRPNKGKLSTYAAMIIKQYIKRALANLGKTIRLPVHLISQIAKMRRVSLALQEKIRREPSYGEIAEEMGMTQKRVSEIMTASLRPLSLDSPLGDGNDNTLSGMIVDEGAENASECVEKTSRYEMLMELVETLDDQECKIIREYFGFGGKDRKSHEEIGQELGLTRERVRQIHNLVLKKLRQKAVRREGRIDQDVEEWRGKLGL